MDKSVTSRRQVVAGLLMGSTLASRAALGAEEEQGIVLSDDLLIDEVLPAKIAARVVQEASLAIDKTLAHAAEPHNFPLPADPNSMERILWQHFTMSRGADLKLAGAYMVSRLRGGVGVASAPRDLDHVNLRSSTSIADQVDALPFPQELAPWIDKARAESSGPSTTPQGAAAAALVASRYLSFRVRQVRCIDETGSTDFRSDEIMLGGTAVDETGDTNRISAFLVRDDFDDGETKTYNPPRSLYTFNLLEGTTYPKYYHVILLMTERDNGGTAELVLRVYQKVKERVLAYLKKGGFIGKIASKILPPIFDEIWKLLNKWFKDDPFPPKTVRTTISSAHRLPSGGTLAAHTTTFTGAGGRYNLTYDWRVYN